VQHAPFAQRVAGARRFDLDDVGAEFGRHAARKRAGNQLSEFEDADSVERSSHASSPSCVLH
jgi:hypothetical protein